LIGKFAREVSAFRHWNIAALRAFGYHN
jgi:hypothetical protein